MSNTGGFASLALEDLEFKIAWRKDDSHIREDALRVWRRMKAITPSQEDERLNSLCVVAYDGEDLVGVSTVGITVYAPVRAKVAWFRCLVLPAYRKKGVATEFAVRCKDVLEEWSKQRPAEKLMAFGTVVETPNLGSLYRKPVWPRTGLTLVGHTKKQQQIRLVWFGHALFEARKKVSEPSSDPTVLDSASQFN